MGQAVQQTRSAVVAIAAIIALMLIALLLVRGTVEVTSWVTPVVDNLGGFATVVLAPLCLVLAAIRRTRVYAGLGFMLIGFIYSMGLWVHTLFYTLEVWGWIAAGFGILIAGVGVILVAFFAATVRGDWNIAGAILSMGLLILICRVFAAFLFARSGESERT